MWFTTKLKDDVKQVRGLGLPFALVAMLPFALGTLTISGCEEEGELEETTEEIGDEIEDTAEELDEEIDEEFDDEDEDIGGGGGG